MCDFVGALDEGTSSTRFVLFDRNCDIAFQEQIELKSFFPHSGWVEMDASEILSASIDCMNKCVKNASKQLGKSIQVHGVGVTVQRETTVVWDKFTGKPFYHALVWSDNRTTQLCKDLEKRCGSKDYFRPVCGLPISPYFSAMKLCWLMEQPDIKQAIEQGRALFGTIDAWLIWNLTGGPNGGVHATDVTNASRTMLMDLKTLQWDAATLEYMKIPAAMLPQIRSCSEVYGTIKQGALKGVPLSASIGDQQAALLGQLCVEPGAAKNTYGTGCFMLMNTGTTPVQSKHGLLTTVGFKLGPTSPCVYALEGSVAVAGSAVRWLRDQLQVIKSPGECEIEAAKVEEGNHGVYFVPAFSGLYSPHWRPDARGVFVGLTQYTTKAHLCRAVIEAVAYGSVEQLDAMQKDSGIALKLLKVDGGMTNSEICMQFQADLLGVSVERPASLEATAKGAAIAAGLAVNFWSGIPQLQTLEANKSGTLRATYVSKMEDEYRSHLMAGWHSAIERTFDQAKFTRSRKTILHGKL
eukprot:gb/GEZN01005997.1/.p1 GENE.gb/GEZN01005997.1/~~gb/GEZN01005997.1/.p1  ORF type:complete len:531 (+),score=62.73 gb/GEZN01005997.1/:25-1593(+)